MGTTTPKHQQIFQQRFKDICDALLTDNTAVNEISYWCSWATTNTKIKGIQLPQPFERILRKLADLDIIERVRLVTFPEPPETWNTKDINLRSVYAIKNEKALRNLHKHCPVTSMKDWEAYTPTQEE